MENSCYLGLCSRCYNSCCKLSMDASNAMRHIVAEEDAKIFKEINKLINENDMYGKLIKENDMYGKYINEKMLLDIISELASISEKRRNVLAADITIRQDFPDIKPSNCRDYVDIQKSATAMAFTICDKAAYGISVGEMYEGEYFSVTLYSIDKMEKHLEQLLEKLDSPENINSVFRIGAVFMMSRCSKQWNCGVYLVKM